MRPPRIPASPEEIQAFALDPRARIEQIVELQRLTKEYWQDIDERIYRRANWRKVEDHARHQIVISARMEFYGKHHPERHVIRYPADWWQALKERFAPAWFRDRYPVQFTTVTASLEEIYPDIEPVLPDQHPTLRLQVASRPDYPVF